MPSGGAGLGAKATTIVITLGLLLCGGQAFAAVDLGVDTSYRSYPLSGILEADTGYNGLLWGSPASAPNGSPLYGYLRAHLDAASALKYNSMAAALDLYPVSFFGVSAGGESIENDANYSSYDCLTNLCRGRFYRTFVQTELTLGWGPVFTQARWRRERWSLAAPIAGDFIEPTGGLALNGQGDSETVARGMVGLKVSADWSVLGVLVYAQNDSSRGISRFPFAVLRYSLENLSVGLGGGVFASPLKPAEGSGVFFLRWDIRPSLALH